MESPQLYDSSDYNKNSVTGGPVKVKGGQHVYAADEYDLAELSAPEISLDLHGLIDDSSLIQDIQGLTVDKNTAPRGLGVNSMYNPLAYLPQPVHGASQFDRQYHHQDRSSSHHDRSNATIKEEPQENQQHAADLATHDYPPCARVGMGASVYGTGATAYSGVPSAYSAGMTPTTVPGADALCRSPLKSPMSNGSMIAGCKKQLDKASDEYKRRRERNNIAVRKSREKAKARSRETEERVKKLIMDNDRLAKKCDLLSKEVAVFHSMFANIQCLPEHVQRELRKHMDGYSQQHQHLVNM